MLRRAAFVLLLIASLSFAYRSGPVAITPFEYRDFGNASLPKFDGMTIVVDCNAATIRTHIASSGVPVAGAMTYLEYADYSTPLLSSGQSDASGNILHRVPSGSIAHMNGIFVLAVEKSGYQRREAHFDIKDCFVSAPPASNSTKPSQPPPQQNATPAGSSANASQPNTTGSNATGNPVGNTNGSLIGNPIGGLVGNMTVGNQVGNGAGLWNPPCPLALMLFAALGICCFSFLRG